MSRSAPVRRLTGGGDVDAERALEIAPQGNILYSSLLGDKVTQKVDFPAASCEVFQGKLIPKIEASFGEFTESD